MAGANDLITVQHRIEGYRWSRLGWGYSNAKPVTISFWVNASTAGTMSVTLKASASVRCYAAPVTINAGGTWEYKTVTIPGDTAGAWNKDNLTGAIVCFTFGAGATRTGTANSWLSTDIYAHTGVSNFYATNNYGILLTGVVVLPGIEAPSAERSALIMRPYDQELVTCQRYYCRSYPHGIANGTASVGSYITMTAIGPSGTTVAGNLSFPGPMRATPTINIWGYAGTASAWSTMAGVDISSGTITPTSTWGVATGAVTAGQVIGTVLATHFVADARL